MEEEYQGELHHPRTSVAFAPTPPFTRAYPEEAAEQAAKFEKPSWADKQAPPPNNPLLTPQEQVQVVQDIQVDASVGLALLISLLAGAILAGYYLRGYIDGTLP